jgi:prepilin-type processing-associated H-X9-DG protein
MTINDGEFMVYRAPSQTWIDVPSDRHSQGGNLSFADGHCEHWKWRAPKQIQVQGYSVISPGDAQDLQQLQAALPDAP